MLRHRQQRDSQVESDMEEYDTSSGRGGFRPWEVSMRKKRSVWYPWWGVGGKDAQSIFEVLFHISYH